MPSSAPTTAAAAAKRRSKRPAPAIYGPDVMNGIISEIVLLALAEHSGAKATPDGGVAPPETGRHPLDPAAAASAAASAAAAVPSDPQASLPPSPPSRPDTRPGVDLPVEIWIQVLSYLDLSSLVRMSVTHVAPRPSRVSDTRYHGCRHYQLHLHPQMLVTKRFYEAYLVNLRRRATRRDVYILALGRALTPALEAAFESRRFGRNVVECIKWALSSRGPGAHYTAFPVVIRHLSHVINTCISVDEGVDSVLDYASGVAERFRARLRGMAQDGFAGRVDMTWGMADLCHAIRYNRQDHFDRIMRSPDINFAYDDWQVLFRCTDHDRDYMMFAILDDPRFPWHDYTVNGALLSCVSQQLGWAELILGHPGVQINASDHLFFKYALEHEVGSDVILDCVLSHPDFEPDAKLFARWISSKTIPARAWQYVLQCTYGGWIGPRSTELNAFFTRLLCAHHPALHAVDWEQAHGSGWTIAEPATLQTYAAMLAQINPSAVGSTNGRHVHGGPGGDAAPGASSHDAAATAAMEEEVESDDGASEWNTDDETTDAAAGLFRLPTAGSNRGAADNRPPSRAMGRRGDPEDPEPVDPRPPASYEARQAAARQAAARQAAAQQADARETDAMEVDHA
ncbi:hypothetical protein CXG81DRAFT_28463 [Caulochytrium protostelioides]|uniref:F-box domain-containing protein n=1 Tax=Caulochytrium protostelioides TaxID=1555241 RepID=A0A4P9X2G8_9FUNG|nr:hypothetical protein CXG81DRAFT_28463 [Caulochytrium protostelioides]|eukprot:RKO98730.1 hypothetical protein CXG81DRAFT_28463 [Caulochytrium protostelioides]